ncbi:conserved hypothetical protein [Burkholderia sp. H160]|nr:conserved hypothetical protein [Burkholderia sp. H160]
MKPHSVPLLMAAALVVAACTAIPSGPSVMVLPGSTKTFDQFLSDDHDCRQFALGPSHSSDSGYGAQYQYDAAYIQCMYARGHRVPVYGPMLAPPPATPPANYKPYFPPPAPKGAVP